MRLPLPQDPLTLPFTKRFCSGTLYPWPKTVTLVKVDRVVITYSKKYNCDYKIVITNLYTVSTI